ncbi:hypothetical protein GQ457_04G002910 [Hibiscus cannabinus]
MLVDKSGSFRSAMAVINTNIGTKRRRKDLALIFKAFIGLNDGDGVITGSVGFKHPFPFPEHLCNSLAAANQQWVTLTSGTLTPKPTAPALAPAVFVETLMPSSGSTVSCAADSASVAMPRKLDSLRYSYNC